MEQKGRSVQFRYNGIRVLFIVAQSSLAPAESVIEMLSHLRVDANQLDFHESATEDGSLYTSRVAEFKPVSESSGTLVYVKQLRHRKQGRRNLEQEQLLVCG